MSQGGGQDAENPPEAEVSGQDFKAQSANIMQDKRMRELMHYTRSHGHETRLRESAELEKRPPAVSRKQLRAEGCEDMDLQMKKLSKEEAVVPYRTKTGELPEAFRGESSKGQLRDDIEARMALLRRMDRFQTRLQWRESMDHSTKRLLVDMDLSRDERLKEYAVKQQAKMDPASETTEEKVKLARFAKARCEHLDKIYHWYEVHGMKEARKERKAPPYLRYNPQSPVMPGSMRVAPPLRELFNKGGMGHSSSSPALLAAGGSVAGGAPLSMAA